MGVFRKVSTCGLLQVVGYIIKVKGVSSHQGGVHGGWLIPVSVTLIDLLTIADQPLGRMLVHRRVTPPGHTAQVYLINAEWTWRNVQWRLLPHSSSPPRIEPGAFCVWSRCGNHYTMEADGYIMEIKQFFTFGYVFEKNVSLKFINQVFLHEGGNLGHALKKM